jgi:hypothetical protein
MALPELKAAPPGLGLEDRRLGALTAEQQEDRPQQLVDAGLEQLSSVGLDEDLCVGG